MKINENSNIRLINNDTYINRLVELHLSAFSNLLSGTIGKRFLRFYYKRIIKDGFIFAYIEDNSMLGFVSGIINEKLLYNIRFYFYAILGIITHIYNPNMILCFIRHIFRIEIYFIVLSPVLKLFNRILISLVLFISNH